MAKFNRKGHRNLTLAEQYERYLEQFYKRLEAARRRGDETPIDKLDNPALSFDEFTLAFQSRKRRLYKALIVYTNGEYIS